MSAQQPTTEAIMQLTRAYAGSKALVSAVELGLFTVLAGGPLTGQALRAKLGLQSRGTADWLDALVSLDMLARDGDLYANTAVTDLYLGPREAHLCRRHGAGNGRRYEPLGLVDQRAAYRSSADRR
jgi:Dimerisation domain